MNKIIVTSKRSIEILILILVMVFGFIYTFYVIKPVLYYHLHQPPFISNFSFFSYYLNRPGGIAEYISLFVSQFFFFEKLGTLLVSLIGIALIVIVYFISKRNSKNSTLSYLVVLPFILYLSILNNYYFNYSVIISLLIMLILLFTFKKVSNSFLTKYVSLILLSAIAYYIGGSLSFVLFLICSFIISFNGFQKSSILFYSFFILIFFSYPLITAYYIFPISKTHLFLLLHPVSVNFMKYIPNNLFYLFLLSFPFVIFANRFLQYLTDKNILKQIGLKSSILIILIIVLIASYSLTTSINIENKNILECDYHSSRNEFVQLEEHALSIEKYNYMINLSYNRAILNGSNYIEKFFRYPQLAGKESLYPDYLYAGEITFIATDYYYDLGYISEARHWAYESLVYFPLSTRALQSLVKVHLILKEYKVAKNYIDVLERGFVSEEFIEKYKPYLSDTTLINKDPELSEKRLLIPNAGELSDNVFRRFMNLLEKNSKNKRAYDNLMLNYLLGGDMSNFMQIAPYYKQYYKELPQAFEEAILIYCAVSHENVPENYKIRPETIARFKEFSNIVKQYKGNLGTAKSLLYEKYGNSFMYYLRFYNPKVTKAKVQMYKDDDPLI